MHRRNRTKHRVQDSRVSYYLYLALPFYSSKLIHPYHAANATLPPRRPLPVPMSIYLDRSRTRTAFRSRRSVAEKGIPSCPSA